MQPGDVLGQRFELRERAASGGMGAVYHAWDRSRDRAVAIKVLLPTSSSHSRDRFAREARVLATLQHPRIVEYIDYGETPDGEPYLAMEWLLGESLVDRLERGPLSIEDSVELCARVADALAAAHHKGVVHRDIKPSNLFLVGGEIAGVKVLDFGIVRLTDGTRMTGTNIVLGTPGYMAPEQASGEHGIIDARADVFSLGCVLFECLTGQPAFAGQHIMAVLAKLLLEDPPRARDLDPSIPRRLDALLTRTLAKDPADRPADGRALALALAHVLDEAADTEGPVLTRAERRMVSIVAVRHDHGDESLTASKTLSDTRTQVDSSTTLPTAAVYVERAIKPLDLHVQPLADGTVLVMLGDDAAGDSATRAARAALAIQRELPNATIVIVTSRDLARRDTTIGDMLEHAASMFSNQRDIILDEVTAAILGLRFDIVEMPGGAMLRGEQSELAPVRTLLGRQTPFVGRDREMRMLFDLIEDAFEEPRGLAIVVTAPPGVGKSRLRHELLHELRARWPDLIAPIVWGDPLAGSSTLSMLSTSLREALRLESGEDLAEQRERLDWFVAQYIRGEDDRRRVAGFMGEVVRLRYPDDHHPLLRAARTDAARMADAIEAAWVDFSCAVAEVQPVLNVLEDLQWGDAQSLRVFESVLREAERLPYVILAFARPELDAAFPNPFAACEVHEVRLRELSRRAARQLVRSALPTAHDDARVDALVERAKGNAFFLEGLIRATAEGRGETLPDTVLGMAEARLASLDAGARRLLRAASVFGVRFWLTGVEALLGEPCAAHIETLIAAEILIPRRERQFVGQEELSFRHALLRESAYAMLTRDDRVLGHQLAGQWLIDAGEEDPLILARHFEHGELLLRSAQYYLRGVADVMRGRPSDAVEAGLAGLSMLGYVAPKTPEAQRAAYLRLRERVQDHIAECSPEELAAAAPMQDPLERAAMKLARHVALSAFGTNPSLGYWLTALSAQLSLDHGHTEDSAAAYALLGAVLANSAGRIADGYALVKLALEIHDWERRTEADARALADPDACKLNFYYVTVAHYVRPWRDLVGLLQTGYEAGLGSGDSLFVSYTCSHLSIARTLLADPLELVLRSSEQLRALMAQHSLASAAATQVVVRQTCACLLGRTQGPFSLTDANLDEDAFVREMERADMSFAHYWYLTAKGGLALLHEEPEAALAPLVRAAEMAEIAFTSETLYLTALTILALADRASPAQTAARRSLLARCTSSLATYAEACPANYRHKHLLVEAERARVAGDDACARVRYEHAIAAAREHDWPRDLGLANELRARLLARCGEHERARACLVDACDAYQRWGATIHVQRVRARLLAIIPR